ncbi:MAG: hypothetical protein F4Y03_09495 [Alphaproteobacteria bacterium]|nr:hypothetical protein [Alphaproteobacteria bacterium]
MFNNPFGSFHDMVAEAKEEREQLDRLLTISTPRERLLVALIALLLFVLAAWLVFGSVTRSLTVNGLLVQPGETMPEGKRSVQALVWIQSGVAGHIKAGMPAAIELGLADGESQTIGGEVATISSVPFSEELAALDFAPQVSPYRLDIALFKDFDFASLGDMKCRIFIDIGTQSPFALLRMRQS